MIKVTNSHNQVTITVATAQPGPPIASIPKPPYINKAFKGSFKASPASCTAVMTAGRETALCSPIKTRMPKLAGRPIAKIDKYKFALA